jgi:hypothetical protein
VEAIVIIDLESNSFVAKKIGSYSFFDVGKTTAYFTDFVIYLKISNRYNGVITKKPQPR